MVCYIFFLGFVFFFRSRRTYLSLVCFVCEFQLQNILIMKYTLPVLPYEDDALEPIISRETIEVHYRRHEQNYLNKLNDMIAGTRYEDMLLTDIIRSSEASLFNNAAQAWNHILRHSRPMHSITLRAAWPMLSIVTGRLSRISVMSLCRWVHRSLARDGCGFVAMRSDICIFVPRAMPEILWSKA